jgi:hypothetical protein
MKNPFVYLRALRHVEHTVFAVTNGQKSYRDKQFGEEMAYSSGQQVKRTIIEAMCAELDTLPAPVTFWKQAKPNESPEQKEAISVCDPSYPDQLIGGYMDAEKKKESKKEKESEDSEKEQKESGSSVVKRRSPLSISAMRPLHPLLGGLEAKKESMTFDRSSHPEHHKVRVRDEKGHELTGDALTNFLTLLEDKELSLSPRAWLKPQTRASGLFIYDVAIDLRTLFSVSLNRLEPELKKVTIQTLKEKGWIESKNVFGNCLVCPKDKRDEIIPALAKSLLDWRITTNQSTKFSLMETLAIAISSNASHIPAAIRADLAVDGSRSAVPIVDSSIEGSSVFVALPCRAHIAGISASLDAVDQASLHLAKILSEFDYENQA